ncbi:hypothetical protein EG329_005032 [Mollisiaceae sp. DMI_Dod_QoI]|nr:hypothetical protein EG329_005032 [Helotiales sp. DMI_Dod_QoI]
MIHSQFDPNFVVPTQTQSQSSQTWQNQAQAQSQLPAQDASAPLFSSGDQLASLSHDYCVGYYTKVFTQPQAITLNSDFSFSKLCPDIVHFLPHIFLNQHSAPTFALQAMHIFFSRNRFLINISQIPTFVAWEINGYKPSHLITDLKILTGPQNNRGLTNSAFLPISSLNNLKQLKIVFRDRPFKPAGPLSWLRPAAYAILLLQAKLGLGLSLHVGTPNSERAYEVEEWDFEADGEVANMRDVTAYLVPATEHESREWEVWQGICDRYEGPAASKLVMLWQAGKSWVTEEMWDLIAAKVSIGDWAEEGRLELLELEDVVMSCA